MPPVYIFQRLEYNPSKHFVSANPGKQNIASLQNSILDKMPYCTIKSFTGKALGYSAEIFF